MFVVTRFIGLAGQWIPIPYTRVSRAKPLKRLNCINAVTTNAATPFINTFSKAKTLSDDP